MKIRVPYEALTSAVATISSAMTGKSTSELIFLVDEAGFTLAGWNPVLHLRTTISQADIHDLEEGGTALQLKLSQVSSFLDTFSSLHKTRADWVEFEDNGSRLVMSVHEVPKDPEKDMDYEQISPFILEKMAVRGQTLEVLTSPFPEESETIEAKTLNFYLGTLLPNMNDETNEGMASKLNFTEDFAFVLANNYASFVKNRLSGVFHDVEISYGSASFLKKLSSGDEEFLYVSKGDYISLRSGQTEAFLRYNRVRVPYENRLKNRTTESGVLLDRGYLQDVIRRMEVAGGGNADLSIEEDGLHVKTENYSQVVPIAKFKGDILGAAFKLPVRIFSKVILGSIAVFGDELFLYLKDSGASFALYMQDGTDSWVSALQVRKDREAVKVQKAPKRAAFVAKPKAVKTEDSTPEEKAFDEAMQEVPLEDLINKNEIHEHQVEEEAEAEELASREAVMGTPSGLDSLDFGDEEF